MVGVLAAHNVKHAQQKGFTVPTENRIVALVPGKARTVRQKGVGELSVPESWSLLEPGDATLTRRVKQAGPCWAVQEKRGRRVFSQGVWAPTERIEEIRAQLAAERDTPEYSRQREVAAKRRTTKQSDYTREFYQAVLAFLRFAPGHSEVAERLAQAVTDHAIPIGSGTVARTERIPIEERAAGAVIAWMRHQTTAYDHMSIARVKDKRRKVRRVLAARSREVLDAYRQGSAVDANTCPLQRALAPPQPKPDIAAIRNLPPDASFWLE